jgi:hypothetical protein
LIACAAITAPTARKKNIRDFAAVTSTFFMTIFIVPK